MKNQNRQYELVKRFLDITLCAAAMIVLLPVYAVAAIGIKSSSSGPIFYTSYRSGKDGAPFLFFKFRSMHMTDRDKGLFVADQERLFPFGAFLRRSKIDELPQLLNVFLGKMSIVGPRPMPVDSVDNIYYGKYAVVKTLKPGLTSLASLYDYVVGDHYTDDTAYQREVLPIKREMELYYYNNRSLYYDTQLVFRTIAVIASVIGGKKEFKSMKEEQIIRAAMATEEDG